MRILHVVPSLDQMSGGPLSVVVDLSTSSRQYGLESEILGFGEQKIEDCKLSPDAFHSLPLNTPRSYHYSRSLRPWLNQNIGRFDGIVTHGLWLYLNWAVHLTCTQNGTRYACFPHGMLDPWCIQGQGALKRLKKTAYWHAREKKVLLEADCLFFTTERERNLSSTSLNILPKRARVVTPFGIGGQPKLVDLPARPELTIAAGEKTALFLGRIHPKKNLHFLIDAWTKAKTPANWRLIIAGPGEASYVAELRKLVESNPRGNTITFSGGVAGNDKAYLLQNSSWFLLPSQQENFGVAVLEAIGNGCPAVISDQVYIADELHRDSEILPLDQLRWIEFFENRMANDDWRARLRGIDAQTIQTKFSSERVGRAWANAVNEVFALPHTNNASAATAAEALQ